MKLTARKEKKVFVPKDPDEAYILIQYLKPGIREQIEQLSNTITAQEDNDGEFGTKVEFNLVKKRRLFFEKVAVGWGGFNNEKDKPLKFTARNLERASEEMEGFYNWLQEESDFFNEEVDEERETETGN